MGQVYWVLRDEENSGGAVKGIGKSMLKTGMTIHILGNSKCQESEKMEKGLGVRLARRLGPRCLVARRITVGSSSGLRKS